MSCYYAIISSVDDGSSRMWLNDENDECGQPGPSFTLNEGTILLAVSNNLN